MASRSPSSTRALFLPFPAQGHVLPLLELAHRFADHGFEVTFVNTDHIHAQLVAASPGLAELEDAAPGLVSLVSVPDGVPANKRADLGSLMSGLQSTLPAFVEALVSDREYCCMVVDYTLMWMLGVAKKAGLRTAALWPSCAAVMAAGLDSPNLIRDSMLDENGLPTGKPIPPVGDLQMNLAPLCWNAGGNAEAQKHMFRCLNSVLKSLDEGVADVLLCNTVQELEEAVLSQHPDMLPVGPLPTGLRQGKPVGNFWPEDDSCMSWLDGQPDKSVLYVAFGSVAVLDPRQLRELARGLELMGRPFLWVVRGDLTDDVDAFADELLDDSVAKRGKIVSWAPQHRVLAHPAVACFVSHCGWNSVMEGARNGLPFLTWPCFADQFINESYVCDVWKAGLRLAKDGGGLVTGEHIASRLEELLNDDSIAASALRLQQAASRSINKDGTSFKNLATVIEAMMKA